MEKKQTIALTMGDPCGIGPELVVKVLVEPAVYERCRPVVIGEPSIMRDAARICGLDLEIRHIEDFSAAKPSPSCIHVFCPDGVSTAELEKGIVNPEAGRAAALCLREAFTLGMAGGVQGVVSAPLNKEAFHLAGFHYLDELEYLSEYTNHPDALIMGVMDNLWTVAVTTHIPFRDIADGITQNSVLTHILALQKVLIQVGVERPRIGVTALNVHGGEGGLFGNDEIEHISPAIEKAGASGVDVYGPIPADSVFVRALDGEFDGVVSMYHDQATIVRKLYAKRRGATIFIGLPVVCGTTAHGTAFDIAGKGVADPGSLSDALDYTIKLAQGRQQE